MKKQFTFVLYLISVLCCGVLLFLKINFSQLLFAFLQSLSPVI